MASDLLDTALAGLGTDDTLEDRGDAVLNALTMEMMLIGRGITDLDPAAAASLVNRWIARVDVARRLYTVKRGTEPEA